jgi:hypothetical protein
VKKQYQFARLFVSLAKGIALFVLFIGIGFCVLRYYRANIAADAVAYKPSPQLRQALDGLKDEFLSTEKTVESFTTGNESATPGVPGPQFPLVIESSDDFVRVSAQLSRVDQDRQQLKESVVSRFETLVKGIEEKLHAYAAALEPSPSPVTFPSHDVAVSVSPPPPAAGPQESLFSANLNVSEVRERNASLKERKDFLKVLATKAENEQNRVILGDAAGQLERLAGLLPETFNGSVTSALDSASSSPKEPPAEDDSKVPPSERVARQLEQLRAGVRQVLLTSWSLDDAFERAATLVSAERDKAGAAALAQGRIWLSATSRIVIGLLAAGVAALLILVFGDLVQTQLDTATSSVTVADAINTLRRSFAGASVSESLVGASEERAASAEAQFTVDEETPIGGRS